jgi:hypothetical protein
MAASAFETMCSPGTANLTSTSSPSAVSRNDARPSAPREASTARTSACVPNPKVTTLPGHRSANVIATGSSAFRIASPSGPSASTGSAEASTIEAHDPKTSMWATPTFVTTIVSGRAIPDSSFTSPTRRAPISATSTSVSGDAPSNVSGRPISLLNDPGLAWTRKRVRATACARSFVDVLPFAPVIPTTVAIIDPRSSAPRRIRASVVEATRTTGPLASIAPSTGSETTAAAAPAAKAWPTNR